MANNKTFKRKREGGTSFYFILCGDAFKAVKQFKDEHEKNSGSPIGWKAAINLIILGK